MTPQEREAARTRFSELFADFFAAPRRDDHLHAVSNAPEFNDDDLHRDLFARRQ